MSASSKFQSPEFDFDAPPAETSEALRRMFNVSAFVVVAVVSVASIFATSRASVPEIKTISHPTAAPGVYGRLEPLTSWNCAGPDCDALRDSLWTANMLAHGRRDGADSMD